MKKLMSFLRLLFFGKQRPTRVFGYGGGGAGAAGAVGHTPAKPTDGGFCLDLMARRQSSRPTPISRPATVKHSEPKRTLVVGDISRQNQIIFCKDNSNGVI
jgi:hypothetical protein